MADNYLQRSHRQDDSRFGNDDPLMELSRIMGTPAEEEHTATGSSEDLAMDLERELMGDFEEHPQVAAPSVNPEPVHSPVAADQFTHFDLQDAVERELMSNEDHSHSHIAAEPVRQVVSEPVAIYEEPDYADYEPETAYTDSEAGEGREPAGFTSEPEPAYHVQPAAAYQDEAVQPERAVVTAPSLSLEDELETLLAGSAKPVVQRAGNASWGYGSQAPVIGRTEAAPVISRATAYVAPVAQPAPVAPPVPVYIPEPAAYGAAPITHESVQVHEPVVVQEDPVDDFDTEELMAAFDDFEVPLDIEEEVAAAPLPVSHEPEAELPRYQSPVHSYAAVHETVQAPEIAAETHHLPEPQDLSGYADELDRAASSISSAPDVHTLAVTENRVEYTESLDLPEVHYEDDAPQHNGLGELETEFSEVFGSIEADDSRAAYAAPQEEPKQPAPAAKDEYADIFADVFGNEAEQGRYAPASYAAAGAGVAAAAAGVAAVSAHQARPIASNYSNGPEDDTDFGYDPKRDNVGMAATAYNQPISRKRSFVVPGAVAAAVLLAVSGAVAYKWTSGSGGTPVVILADKTPIKVQPETTANTTAPVQDKIVYEKGATADTSPPKQQQLVTTQENPVDLAAGDDEDIAAGSKAEERVDPAAANVASSQQPAQPNDAIAPRKVQTMVVKPDGTMVAAIPQAADPVSAGPAAAPVARPAPAAAPVNAMPAGNDQIGSLAAASNAAAPKPTVEPLIAKPQAPASGKLPAKAVETKKITAETVASVTPKNVPIVDSRPAEQPLNVVDRVVPQKAAGQQVASVAVAPGTYLIQVASQPTAEGAQKTYASMAQRYSSVIGGRGVDIKQAEIAGKGTFYRVRIPAGTKDAAVNLCTKFKSAGGSCFVTQ